MSEPNACNVDLPDMQLHDDGMPVDLSKDGDGAYTATSIDVTSPNRGLGNVRIGRQRAKGQRRIWRHRCWPGVHCHRISASRQRRRPMESTYPAWHCVRHIRLNSYTWRWTRRWRRWLGRQDSNLGMSVPKTDALPLGDAPSSRNVPAARGLIGRADRKLNAEMATVGRPDFAVRSQPRARSGAIRPRPPFHCRPDRRNGTACRRGMKRSA